MKTTQTYRLSIKKLLFFIAILYSSFSFAQDSTKTAEKPFYIGQFQLKNPNSIISKYTYDSDSNMYIYTEKAGTFNIIYPKRLTVAQYQKLVLQEAMGTHFKDKLDAMASVKSSAKAKQKNLLPALYVNNDFFKSIFGGNTVEVIPKGSLSLDLGINYQKRDNPQIAPDRRSSINPLFDQKISMSMLGKVGTRLKVNANFDTNASFEFQQLIKLEFDPNAGLDDDGILRKIEVGNVSMPLNSSLITGAQSLFGFKTQLQFGKTTVTAVLSKQKSETKTITAQGDGKLEDFERYAIDYEQDRHFFLAQYFRDNYDKALAEYPFIRSKIKITKIEVWKTNRTTQTENIRNIVALQDLGESDPNKIGLDTPPAGFILTPNSYPDNSVNGFNPETIGAGSLLTNGIRDIATVSTAFSGAGVNQGLDYAMLENAKKLNPSEYTLQPELGYITLNSRLNNDEILAVSFQFTVGSQVYQVGEFASDGIESPKNLVVKLLRSNISNVNEPLWNLMMKNIYSVGYQLEEEDFKLNILYSESGVPINYLTETAAPLPADVVEKVLLKVFNLDRLNFNNDPQQGGDGFFDFLQGITVDKQNGRIIFTSVEPFGEYIFNKLRTSPLEDYTIPATYNTNQLKYVYRQLYTGSKANALQNAELNKFMLKGHYKSTGANGISLGVYNVPRGSVHVTAGGRTLQEGVDYVVNYQMGKVQILDPSLSNSSTPIRVSVENNAVFSQQQKSFTGLNIEHKFSDKIMLGATYLHLNEKPITTTTSYGLESVNNTIFGLNAAYSNEVPFLTRLANKLPNIDTDAPSNFSFNGEFAYLKPGSPKRSEVNGEATTYVDDFESAQSIIDLKSPLSWKLSSTPAHIFPEGSLVNNFDYGKNRARLNWYTIDYTLYSSRRPDNIDDNEISKNETRFIELQELFPEIQLAETQRRDLPTFDLAYYPDERGAYNYDTNNVDPGTGKFINPADRWGGITRALTTTDFEQANVEYIEFWLLDPYTNNTGATGGELHFNLGSVSEDILADRRKFYENGLPADGAATNTITTWSKIPDNQSLIYAFDNDEAHRVNQDVGYDGYNDAEEATQHSVFLSGLSGAALAQAQEDPSTDNYKYFLNVDSPSILERYRYINGVDGNSPTNTGGGTQGGVTIPDVEDINRDQTMNTIESFFDYTVPLHPNMTTADRYVSDIKTTTVNLQNGGTLQARWIQFKIPIYNMDNVTAYGGIGDFRSIRFMRMFLKDFDEPVVLRFGKLELKRGDWRRYRYTLDPLDPNPDDDGTVVDVNAVNIFANEGRQPIPYVIPPGIVRDQQYQNNTVIALNEQSLSMRVCELEKTDSRGVYKNISIDMRQYKRLKMFIHMEEMDGHPLVDDDLIGYIRIGSDVSENYYQIELPLKVTPWGSTSDTEIWPEANQIDLALKLLNDVKLARIQNNLATNVVQWFDEDVLDPSTVNKPNKLRIGIKGNPDFGDIRTLMVGIKNAGLGNKCGEAWFDELRLANLSNEGGWAAISTIDANIADFATMSLTGKISTIGFGEIQQRPNERSIENNKEYNFITNVNAGQLLPKKWNITVPINYSYSEQFIDPQYDPILRDVKIEDRLNIAQNQAEKDSINSVAQNYTQRKSVNLIGVKKGKNPKSKPHFYDVSNFVFSYSYNEMNHHDFEVESYTDKNVRVTSDYAYSFKPLTLQPFKKAKFKSKNLKFIKDFNLNLLPSSIAFTSSINRQFNAQKYRELEDFGIGLDKLYKRNFMLDYAASVTYNLTKSIKLNYQNANHNIVKNYIDDNGNTVDGITVWDGFWNLGEANHHHTSIGMDYKLPFKKFPVLNFIDATYSYKGDFDWQKGSDALTKIKLDPADPNSPEFDLGNTIQNANTQNISATLNMKTLYKTLGVDKLRRKKRGRKPKKPSKDVQVLKKGKNKVTITKKNAPRRRNKPTFKNIALDLLTSLKTVNLTYKKTSGISLPGYLQDAGYFGTFDPTIDFVMGSRTDIRKSSALNGYLTNYPDFTKPYTEVSSEFLDFKAVVEPIRGLKINITANKDYASNYSEQYQITGTDYNALSPNTYGNFSMSMNMLRTAFDESTADKSVTYEQFRKNRIVIAQRLAGDPINPNATTYPDGYGANNQAVLLPAFFAAYSGKDATNVELGAFRDVPLPNWKLTYSGFTKIKWIKKRFKRISITHGYRSSYTINQFRTNLEYTQNPGGRDASNNFLNETLFSNINMTEQFNPLVKVDMEFKNSLKLKAELKTDRTLNMSFDNNMLTEINGKEYVFGMGYRIKNLKFKTRFGGKKVTLKGDLNIKADLKIRNNLTVIRNLEASNNQITGGQNMWGLKVTADYNLTRSLSAKLFYDHSFSKFAISTAFPTTMVRSGISITYKLGN